MGVLELTAADTHLAFEAMRELRTHLTSAADFVEKVNGEQRSQGYRLVGSFEEGEAQAVSVAGFRVISDLVHGRHLYVDDLSTREAFRKRGHADAVMNWLIDEATGLECAFLSLDSGVHRFDAHRFYLKHGMRISSHHFSLELDRPSRRG